MMPNYTMVLQRAGYFWRNSADLPSFRNPDLDFPGAFPSSVTWRMEGHAARLWNRGRLSLLNDFQEKNKFAGGTRRCPGHAVENSENSQTGALQLCA
jgi:hypothetical protein